MTGRDPVVVLPLPTNHRFVQGDDLIDNLTHALLDASQQLRDGEVVCVVSKVVSLVEGRLVAITDTDARTARRRLARKDASAIVADTPGVLVTRTPQGFVLANGGIDASNVADGHALLLPADADASARRLRHAIARLLDVNVAVVVTDSFGRPWRHGQLDTAIGSSGLTTLRDERHKHDLDGRELAVTIAAVVDAIAAASDLVRTKASGTPFVLVRGLAHLVADRTTEPPGVVASLVRPLAEDLFSNGGPTAADEAVRRRRTVRSFDLERAVDDEAVAAAVRAAATAPAPHHTQPWRFIRLDGDSRRTLLDAMAQQWRKDLTADGVAAHVIDRRLARSDEVLRTAPVLLAGFVELKDAHPYADTRRAQAERDLFLLSGGAALANAQIVLAARGLGSAWLSTTTFCPDVARKDLDLPTSWIPIGMLAIGWPREPVAARPAIDPTPFVWSP